MIGVSRRTLTRHAALAAVLVATLGVSGCASPAPSLVEFTSDTGTIGMDVPEAWEDRTEEARGNVGWPGMTIEAAWILTGTPGVDASSIAVVTYEAPGMTTEEFADASTEAIEDLYPAADVVKRESFTGDSGIVYERQDITTELPGARLYQVELWAVVDGVGIEIAITLFNDGDAFLHDALDAARSVTLR